MKKCYNVCKKQVFHDFRLEPSEEAQHAPKTTPGASPGTPKATPEASRAAPESPKSAPGEAQEPPGGTPKSVYTRFCPPESPKSARERPRSHLREVLQAILEPPGPHLGAVWEPPGPHFQAFSMLSKDVAPAAIVSLKCWVGGCPR